MRQTEAQYLMHPVESGAVLSWWSGVVVRQRWNSVWIHNLFFLRWFGPFSVMNLSAAEISVIGTIYIQVVQHTLV